MQRKTDRLTRVKADARNSSGGFKRVLHNNFWLYNFKIWVHAQTPRAIMKILRLKYSNPCAATNHSLLPLVTIKPTHEKGPFQGLFIELYEG